MGTQTRPISKAVKTFMWLPPLDITGAQQGPNREFVCMKNYPYVEFLFAFGNVAGDVSITFEQALNVGGNSNKALAFRQYWSCNSRAATPNLQDLWSLTTAATCTVTAAGHDNYLYRFEFKSDELDVDNRFDCIRPNISSPGANACLACVIINMHDGKFIGSLSGNIMPSMMIN